jgi:membrane associated rhomboid family serine protease
MSITYLLILITAGFSIAAFNNQRIIDELILWPAQMQRSKQFYRLFTCSLIHANWPHLIFNMITLYFFGRAVENVYAQYFGAYHFLLLYVLGVVVSSIPTYVKYRNNYNYRSLGASGGVAAILFAFIFLSPWTTIYFIVLPLPGVIFGIIYLVYTVYMSRQQGGDGINHDAHFWGAIAGITYTFLLEPKLATSFIHQITHPNFF